MTHVVQLRSHEAKNLARALAERDRLGHILIDIHRNGRLDDVDPDELIGIAIAYRTEQAKIDKFCDRES